MVESANSALKGAFADLSRGFLCVMGLVKTTILLGFRLAAYNLDRVRSFKAKHGLDADGQVSKSQSSVGLVGAPAPGLRSLRRPARLPHRRSPAPPLSNKQAKNQGQLQRVQEPHGPARQVIRTGGPPPEKAAQG